MTLIYIYEEREYEKGFKVPSSKLAREVNFNQALINPLEKIVEKDDLLDSDMDVIWELILKYKMNESDQTIYKVTQQIKEFYIDKENEWNNLEKFGVFVFTILQCIMKVFLHVIGDEKVYSFPNEDNIDEIVKLLNSANRSIFLCLNKLTNNKIIDALVNLWSK